MSYIKIKSSHFVAVRGIGMLIRDITIIYDGHNFGEFIREVRTNLSLTQKELCEAVEQFDGGKYAGLSYSSLRNYEQNKSVPKYPQDLIDALYDVFKDEIESRGIRLLVRG